MPAEEVTLTVESSAGGIDDGDTVSGTIINSGTKTVETADGDIDYYEVDVGVNGVDMELTADWPARITESTGLGATLERFGVELVQGTDIALHEIFSVGTEVEFEVETEDAPESATVDEYINIQDDTLRPEGADLELDGVVEEEDESGEAGDGETIEDEVMEVVQEYMGDSKEEAVNELGKISNEHVVKFNELADEEFTVAEGNIMPA